MASIIWNPGIDASNPTVELIVTQQSQNTEGNYSIAAYSLVLHRPSTIYSSSSKSYNVKINNVTVASGSTTIGGVGNKTIASGTTIIYHNADGTKKNVPLSFYMGIGITWSGEPTGNASGSGQISFSDIPRATTPTLNYSTREMGQSVDISLTPAVSTFSHKIYYSFTGIANTLIATLPAGNQVQAWTLPTATLASKIPNAISGVVTITAETYGGATLIGTKTVTFTATVPSYQPSASQTLTGVDQYSGKYVQGKSKVTVDITAAGLYGSAISTYKTVVNGSTYNTASLTTEVLNTAGSNTIETTVTDTRGKTKVVSQAITVEAYTAPQATYLVAYRSDAAGTADPGGSYIKATIQASISPIANTNTKQTLVKYKKKADSTWTTALNNTTAYAPNTSVVFAADGNYPYDVMLEVNDYFNSGTVNRSVSVGTAFTLMDLHSGGESMAIGKVAEGAGLLELGGEILSMGNFNRGTWGTPTKGAITQLIDETENQHSVIVGRNASGERVYGIDLYDRTDDPIMRLYAGDKNIQLSATGVSVNGNSLKKEVLGETALILTDINQFGARTVTTLTTSYPQLITISKIAGGLTIASDIITLEKGYLYEMELDLYGLGAGLGVLSVYDTSNNDLMIKKNVAIGVNYTGNQSQVAGKAVYDLTAAGSNIDVKVVNTGLAGSFAIQAGYGNLLIKKYKKITI